VATARSPKASASERIQDVVVLVAKRKHSGERVHVSEEFQCPDLVEPEVVPGRRQTQDRGEPDDGRQHIEATARLFGQKGSGCSGLARGREP
jgi:hypothetical protein